MYVDIGVVIPRISFKRAMHSLYLILIIFHILSFVGTGFCGSFDQSSEPTEPNAKTSMKTILPDLNEPLVGLFGDQDTKKDPTKMTVHDKRLKRFAEDGTLEEFRAKERMRSQIHYAKMGEEKKRMKRERDSARMKVRLKTVSKENNRSVCVYKSGVTNCSCSHHRHQH